MQSSSNLLIRDKEMEQYYANFMPWTADVQRELTATLLHAVFTHGSPSFFHFTSFNSLKHTVEE